MYRILLEIYKDKLSNKLHFILMILDSLKVISEKPQVNQVVPYISCASFLRSKATSTP